MANIIPCTISHWYFLVLAISLKTTAISFAGSFVPNLMSSILIPPLPAFLLFLSWLITMDISSYENGIFIKIGCRSDRAGLSFLNGILKWLAIILVCFFPLAVYWFLCFISNSVFDFIFHCFKHTVESYFGFSISSIYLSSLFVSSCITRLDFGLYFISFLTNYLFRFSSNDWSS